MNITFIFYYIQRLFLKSTLSQVLFFCLTCNYCCIVLSGRTTRFPLDVRKPTGCVGAQREEGQTGLPTVLEAAPTAQVCSRARDTHFKRKPQCEEALALFLTSIKAFTPLNGVCAYAFLHHISTFTSSQTDSPYLNLK